MQPAAKIAQRLSQSAFTLELLNIAIPNAGSAHYNPHIDGVLTLAAEACWRAVTPSLGAKKNKHNTQSTSLPGLNYYRGHPGLTRQHFERMIDPSAGEVSWRLWLRAIIAAMHHKTAAQCSDLPAVFAAQSHELNLPEYEQKLLGIELSHPMPLEGFCRMIRNQEQAIMVLGICTVVLLDDELGEYAFLQSLTERLELTPGLVNAMSQEVTALKSTYGIASAVA